MTLLLPVAVTALLVAYGIWTLTAPGSLAGAQSRVLTACETLWATRGGVQAKRRAQTLGWPAYRVPATAAVLTLVFVAVLAAAARSAALVGLPLAAAAAWATARARLDKAYAAWRAEMLRGLPGLITTLRIHLDLGLTVPDALRAAMAGSNPVLRHELGTVLADMASADHAPAALTRLAERTESREWRVFADTLGQAWDTQLSGDALEPLSRLTEIVRSAASRSTTGKLDRVTSTAPGLALLAIVILGAGGYMLTALHGGGGAFGP